MENNQHNEALQILRTIILKERGGSKVVSLLQMIRCQIEIGQIVAAITTSEEVAEILTTKVGELRTQTKARCHEELLTVVARFIETKRMDTAFLLLQRHFILVKDIYGGEIKLHKMNKLGYFMELISKKFHCQGSYKLKDFYVFLDDVLQEMQNLNQIDDKKKSRAIASFMKHYGSCCNNFHRYGKSMELFKQAIFLMNSMFGVYAAKYQLLGDCHYNLALAFEHTTKFDDVVEACDAALDIYKQANDWDNVEQKAVSISRVTLTKENVAIKRKSYKLFWDDPFRISEKEMQKLRDFYPVTAKRSSLPPPKPPMIYRHRKIIIFNGLVYLVFFYRNKQLYRFPVSIGMPFFSFLLFTYLF